MAKSKTVKDICPYLEAKCASESECPCAKYKAYERMNQPGVIEEKLKSLGCDINMDSWSLLMTMQKQFAAKFHKVDGLEKKEKDYWINAYLVCIEDECREVREHLSFDEDDNENFKLVELKKELIDILHFAMDAFIVGGMDSSKLKEYYLKTFTPNVIDVRDFLQYAYDYQNGNLAASISDFENGDHTFDLMMLRASSILLDTNGMVRQQISWKHWKKPSAEINEDKLYTAFAYMFKSLMNMFCLVEMTPEDIRDIYVKKNVENILRQEFGY